MKKRLLSLLLCLCMAATLLPTTAWAVDDSAEEGDCGNGVGWNYQPLENVVDMGKGTLTIGGSGAIPDYTLNDRAPWGTKGATITILEDDTNNITRIGNYAFYQSHVASIFIPDSVKSIGDHAFAQCTYLTEANIPNSVTSIGESAFSGCSQMTSVTLPEGLIEIKDSTFESCTNLNGVHIPSTVKSIGNKAFYNCPNWSGDITVPANPGEYAFSGCSMLQDVTFQEGVTTIEAHAFANCIYLTTITVPTSMELFKPDAFDGCDKLKTVVYKGTSEEWRTVRGTNNLPSGYKLICEGDTGSDNPDPVIPGDQVITNYDGLTAALEEGQSPIYLRPAADFGWPTADTTVTFSDTQIVLDGTWTIPQNVTLNLEGSCAINNSTLWQPKISVIDLHGKFQVDKTHDQGNSIDIDCDLVVRSGATFDMILPENADPNYTVADIHAGRTWTVERGGNLNIDYLGLRGTLTGTGTISSEVSVEDDYSPNNGPVATNAVLSGSLTLTNNLRISGSEANINTLTIPAGSSVNFVAKIDRTWTSEDGKDHKDYTAVILNERGRLNLNGTLNVKLSDASGIDDGDYNGKDIVHFNNGDGCVTLGQSGLLDVTYPCQVGWHWWEDATTPAVAGSGTVRFHHTAPAGDAWLKLPEGANLDRVQYRDFLYRESLISDIRDRNSTDPNAHPIRVGTDVRIEYDWDCKGTHTWKTHFERAATCIHGGYQELICPGCMMTKSGTETPALGHNFSTTAGEDGKYHCLNEGCTEALDTAPVKLPTPTNLTWGGDMHSDDGTSFTYPAMLNWSLKGPFEHRHDIVLCVYRAGSGGQDTLVWSGTYDTGVFEKEGPFEYSDLEFSANLPNDLLSGSYYFTVQVKMAPHTNACHCNAGDVAKSPSWAYTKPDKNLANPSNLTWDGKTAKWSETADSNLYRYNVEFYASDNPSIKSVEDFEYSSSTVLTNPGETSFTLRDEDLNRIGGRYIYFTVQASSKNVTVIGNSDIALSPAYDTQTGTSTNPGGDNPSNPGGSTGGNSGGSSSGSSGGSSSNTSSTTTKNPDGSTTTTTENKSTGTVTETTKNPDGSRTVVETRKDGTVTTTETDKAGNKTETVEKPDGSSVTKVAQKDGTTATVSTDASGQVEAEVALPKAAVSEAQSGGEAVTLPIPEVTATRNTGTAPAVTVKTGSSTPVKVEIPTANTTPGTVAVIVKADGSEEIVKTSVPTDNGVAVSLPDGATVKIVDNSKSFADVPASSWAADAVSFSSARELFGGTSETTFTPEAPMTRAMMVTVLARFDGADTSGGSTWYQKGVDWAVAKGVSNGSDPNGSITREQLATMLWRYSGSPASSGTLEGFTDASKVSDYAQEAMRWAVENGIINGYGNGQLGPQGNATRAQVAQLLKNFIEK